MILYIRVPTVSQMKVYLVYKINVSSLHMKVTKVPKLLYGYSHHVDCTV